MKTKYLLTATAIVQVTRQVSPTNPSKCIGYSIPSIRGLITWIKNSIQCILQQGESASVVASRVL